MAKLVDAPDLGSGAARRGGSSPSTRTTTFNFKVRNVLFEEKFNIIALVNLSNHFEERFCADVFLQWFFLCVEKFPSSNRFIAANILNAKG